MYDISALILRIRLVCVHLNELGWASRLFCTFENMLSIWLKSNRLMNADNTDSHEYQCNLVQLAVLRSFACPSLLAQSYRLRYLIKAAR